MNLGCGNGSKGCLMDKRGGMGHRGKGDGGLGEGEVVGELLPGQRIPSTSLQPGSQARAPNLMLLSQ